MKRDQNFQKISWFWDHYQRGLLNLDPPYQRRSVWNQEYKDYFIDTVLLGYPAPALFLYEETEPDGRATYNVVDGKQRLSTIFEFIGGEFPVAENAEKTALRGLYFKGLSDNLRVDFFNYKFSVEYIPATDENIINGIFDRINRNTAKLSPQELRHARFDGEFITAAEELTEYMQQELPPNFPRIVGRSRRQMKDIELTSEVLLYLEIGPRNLSQAELDEAFSSRESAWEQRRDIEKRFRRAIEALRKLTEIDVDDPLVKTRFRNQADFYSLFGTIASLQKSGKEKGASKTLLSRLTDFATKVDSAEARGDNPNISKYYDAVRSHSNDTVPRTTRIQILTALIQGS